MFQRFKNKSEITIMQNYENTNLCMKNIIRSIILENGMYLFLKLKKTAVFSAINTVDTTDVIHRNHAHGVRSVRLHIVIQLNMVRVWEKACAICNEIMLSINSGYGIIRYICEDSIFEIVQMAMEK